MDINLHNTIFGITDDADFKKMALVVFEYQYRTNAIYRRWAEYLNKTPETVSQLTELPFLPVEFFKNHIIVSGSGKTRKIFESSGTTGSYVSKHYVTDLDLYTESFMKTFGMFYGSPSEYIITALLPSYTERENSSLVYMVNSLIETSNNPLSGFYNIADSTFIDNIISPVNGKKRLLFGVSFALLDLAAAKHPDLSGSIVMETGGMKGKRKEITRHELHKTLTGVFNVPVIHSEYGMTELLSQAYSKGNGIFYPPPWMKIVIRDLHDPLTVFTESGHTGGINIIDLANIYSCSFIATGDIGKLLPDGGFDVTGRFDNSDIRGCNLLTETLM